MDVLSGQTVSYNERFFFGQLYDLFNNAPSLGSLINPHRFLSSGWLSDKDRRVWIMHSLDGLGIASGDGTV